MGQPNMTPSSSVNQGDATQDRPETPTQEDSLRASTTGPRKCPACLYSLSGMPARHVCPECGFEYDEHVRLWEAPQRGRVKDILCLSLGFALLFFMLAYLFIRFSVSIWVIVGCCLAVIIEVWTARLPRDYIAVTSTGIFYRVQSRRVKKIPWPNVDEVWYRGKKPSRDAALFYKKGWFTWNVTIRHILVTEIDRRLFTQAVEEGKRRYNEAHQ